MSHKIKKFYTDYEHNIKYVLKLYPNKNMISIQLISYLFEPKNDDDYKIFFNKFNDNIKNNYNVVMKECSVYIGNYLYYFNDVSEYNRFIMENI